MKLHNMQLCGALVSIAGNNSSIVHFSLTLTHSALHPTQGRMPKNLHCKRKPAWQLLLLQPLIYVSLCYPLSLFAMNSSSNSNQRLTEQFFYFVWLRTDKIVNHVITLLDGQLKYRILSIHNPVLFNFHSPVRNISDIYHDFSSY